MSEIIEFIKSKIKRERLLKAIIYLGLPLILWGGSIHFPTMVSNTKFCDLFLSFELFAFLAVMLTVSLAALVNFSVQLARLTSDYKWENTEEQSLKRILKKAEGKGKQLVFYLAVIICSLFLESSTIFADFRLLLLLTNITLTFWFLATTVNLFFSQLVIIQIEAVAKEKR